MIAAIFEPRFFNILIMSLYVCAILWWGIHGKFWDAGYWCAAFAITFIVTFGYKH